MAERSGKNDTEIEKHLQYKPLFDRLEKEKIPVLFADVKYKYNDFALILADNFVLRPKIWTQNSWFLVNNLALLG
jgi:hypothetical protein